MDWGVTPEGFLKKTYQDILTGIRERISARIDQKIHFAEQSPQGQITASFAEEESSAWHDAPSPQARRRDLRNARYGECAPKALEIWNTGD